MMGILRLNFAVGNFCWAGFALNLTRMYSSDHQGGNLGDKIIANMLSLLLSSILRVLGTHELYRDIN